MSRLVETSQVAFEVSGRAPRPGSTTRFAGHVVVRASRRPFFFGVELTPQETRELIAALQGELARIGEDDE